MAQVLVADPDRHKTGLYDSWTGGTLIASKVVDITDNCPEYAAGDRGQVLLLYMRDSHGQLVQVREVGEGGAGAVHIHFFVDNLDRELRATHPDDTLGLTAKGLGLSKESLVELIREHAL